MSESTIIVAINAKLLNENTYKKEEEHHHEANSVTIWTESSELFMEYPSRCRSEDFPVNLSNMKNFKPITERSLQIIFSEKSSGKQTSLSIDSPALYKV